MVKVHADLAPAVWPFIYISLTAFFVASLAVGWLARSRRARIALDLPNERSLHTVPVPRTGGIGLLLGVSTGWAIVGPQLPWLYWSGALLVIAVSLIDDLHGLTAPLRLGVHLFAAALAVTTLVPAHTSPLIMVIATLSTGWMCNLYNFMDGSDGLAGGMAFFGFFFYAVAAAMTGNTQFALLNFTVAAAAAGFLIHNFHPSRIFLGDAGAVPLGFLAATFGIIGCLQDLWGWWFPVLVFSPFIVDASVTLIRRLLSGFRVWEAHRDHYYQRVVQMGLGHRNTALVEYALMVTCGFGALWAATYADWAKFVVLTVAGAVYVGLIAVIERKWRSQQNAKA